MPKSTSRWNSPRLLNNGKDRKPPAGDHLPGTAYPPNHLTKGSQVTGSPFALGETMKKEDLRPPVRRDVAPGTRASELMLQNAAARLAFRRARDTLPVKIETARLVLRAPIRGDVPAIAALADNKNIASRLSRLPHPYTRADATAFVEIFAQRADERPYAITLDEAFLGIVGFTFAIGQYPELGYWLGEPHWGKGYATEAVKGLIEAAHQTRHFSVIRARALTDNAPSIHVLEKAGFANIGEAIDPLGANKGKPVFQFRLEQPR
jgi:RimJ/RimL family protein N-acetyltransferase